jgi:ligand-binding sensor domain-containing protein/DNA-binding CsgD family transcriptional regulator
MIKYIFTLLSFFTLFSQELSPIQSFGMDDYNAAGQNWMISQSDDGSVFFANSDGLLKYNGSLWSTYKSAKNTIIRSVKNINNIIYTGQVDDFGFWSKNNNGSYSYTSIPDNSDFELIDDEEFWNILEFKNWIVFQSLSRLVFFDPNTQEINFISPNGGVWKSFVIDNNLYFFISNKGIYKIEEGGYVPHNTNILFRENDIIGLYKNENNLLALTRYSGFYNVLTENKISTWKTYLNDLNQVTVYSSLMNKDGSFSVGTVKKGLIKIDKNGNLVDLLNKQNSIINNTVLSVFEDKNRNLWLGLDNGISVVNYNSPFKIYEDYEGLLGTVYAFKKYKSYTYVGTNQGLYFKTDSPASEFSLIDGMTGQVWSLEIIDDQIFCGHVNGTFIIKNNSATKIPGTEGSWTFRKIKSKDLILEGNYFGLNVLEKDNGIWKIKNSIPEFDLSTRFFELTDNNKLIVVHGYKGVYKLELDELFENLKSIEIDSLSISGNPSLANFNDKIYYKNKNGMYYYNEINNNFLIDSLLSKAANPTGLIRADNDKLWIFSDNNIFYASKDEVNNKVSLKSVLIPKKQKRTIFENISSDKNGINIIGTNSGYVSFDLKNYKLLNNNFSIDKIQVNSIDTEPSLIDVKNGFILEHNRNNITFNYSVSNYQLFEKNEFQHRLIGYSDTWSSWSDKPSNTFNNLADGDYIFQLRTKNGNLVNPEVKVLSFEISPPWYLSNFMLINYFLLSVIFWFLTNMYTRRYYNWKENRLQKINRNKLQLKEIERKQTISNLENKQLQQDIENKNRELAASTMSMIKKNQFLNKIKNDLKKTGDSQHIFRVIKTIDSNLNNEDDWRFFEEAFNNADREFLKKIKRIHNKLTKNDLKLCAYLRLNLSSKDIAPLLNISLRSVEIKRYRLRKKMKLSHNEGLTEYILSI